MAKISIPVVTVALLVMSACGGNTADLARGGSPSHTSVSAPATQPGADAGTGNGGDPADGGSISGGGGKLTPAQRETLTKLRACMIRKGYDMPEINPNNPIMAPKNNNGKSNDQVNQDAAECATQSQGG